MKAPFRYAKTGISISIIAAIFAFTEDLFAPFIAPYASTFFTNEILLSILFAFFPLVVLFTSFFIGGISDVIGRIKVIRVGIIFQIFACLIYIFLKSQPFLFFARTLDALAFSAVILVALAKVEDASFGKKRGELTGFHESLVHGGKILGPLVGGFLADFYFIQAPFITSFIILFVLLFCLYFIKDDMPISVKKENFTSIKKQFSLFWKNKNLQAVAFLGIVVFFASPAISVFLPLFILKDLHGTYFSIGFVFLMLQFMYLFEKYFGILADKYSPKKMIVLGILIHAFSLAFIPISSKIWVLGILALLNSWGGAMWNIGLLSILSATGESLKMEGGIVGAYAGIVRLGSLTSYFLSGFIVVFFGIGSLFLFNGIFQAIAAIIVKKYYFKV